MQEEFFVQTRKRIEMHDITANVQDFVSKQKVLDCLCNVFVPHTTAGIILQENSDPLVQEDLLEKLQELVPEKKEYMHLEGNADSHIKTAIVGNSVAIPIKNGRLMLGQWQAIFLCEFDGPRKRKILLTLT